MIRYRSNKEVAPVIYPEYYDTVSELIDVCESAFQKAEEYQNMVSNLNILDTVRIGLAKEVSEDVIQRKQKYHGMTKYLYCDLGNATTKVTRSMLGDVTERKAWDAAKRNTFADFKVIDSSDMFGGPTFFYVVTNRNKYLGASSVLNTDAIREKLGKGRYYVCPSSIHEVLLVPFYLSENLNEISAIVKAANSESVRPEERLSDKAFILEVV